MMTIPLHAGPTSDPPCNYRSGDRIRVTRGTLTGQVGKFAWLSDLNDCVLTIDGLSDGVYVILNRQSLEVLEEG